MYPETFYSKIQNCIYHSLREYCGITKDAQNGDVLPVVKVGMECHDTLVFLDRMFNDKSISYEKDPGKVMEKYRRTFQDSDGIQAGWVEHFEARVKSKMPLDDNGIAEVAAIIMKEWGCRNCVVAPAPSSPESPQRISLNDIVPTTRVEAKISSQQIQNEADGDDEIDDDDKLDEEWKLGNK